MSDVKKIATRESYGKTLVELGAKMPLPDPQRPVSSRRFIRIDFLTAVLRRAI